jgi:hypothetical protein
MIRTEDFQTDSIKSLQKKTGLFLAIILVLLLFRITVLAFDKFDIQSILVSRSFVGNGLLSKPLFSELLFSILIILLLFRKEQIKKPQLSDLTSGIINSIWFISFPIITGLCLFTFKQQYYFKLQFSEMILMRWFYFCLSFVAVNLILNLNPFQKFIRFILIISILLLSSFLQDFASNPYSLSVPIGIFAGVGLTQALSIIAFRNAFKNSFWAGVFSALISSIVVCFLILGGVSNSLFTLFFPFAALIVAAITMRSKSLKPRIIGLGAISLVCLFLSLVLPKLVAPQYGDGMRENRSEKIKYQESVNGIQINYNDTSVHKSLAQLTKILQAANQVSHENFGISPDIKWITVYGIEIGGFNAVFPQGIAGNFLSLKYLNNILDSSFMNNPNLSCQFPDPVNSILHEYAHLFGVFPYQNWIGTESEGWATYAATRLSKLIYQKYGPTIWQPAYNYSKIADSINASLLSGHPLIWSHPEEVGSFKMWNDYENKKGLQDVFKDRWLFTSRDKNSVFIKENNPSVVTDFIDTKIGKGPFDQYSNIPAKKFDELYKPDDWIIFGQLINIKEGEINKLIEQKKTSEYNVFVPKPRNNSAGLNIVVISCLLGVFAFSKFKLIKSGEQNNLL